MKRKRDRRFLLDAHSDVLTILIRLFVRAPFITVSTVDDPIRLPMGTNFRRTVFISFSLNDLEPHTARPEYIMMP